VHCNAVRPVYTADVIQYDGSLLPRATRLGGKGGETMELTAKISPEALRWIVVGLLVVLKLFGVI
jgi:hypothetical protein